jgi:hypothetical protein
VLLTSGVVTDPGEGALTCGAEALIHIKVYVCKVRTDRTQGVHTLFNRKFLEPTGDKKTMILNEEELTIPQGWVGSLAYKHFAKLLRLGLTNLFSLS